MTIRHLTRLWLVSTLSALLVACGGGGSDDDSSGSTYLAVTGVKQVNGNPIVTVCLNNIANASSNSLNGQQVAANLARFYLITGNYQITSSDGKGCDSIPGAVVLSVDEYNNIVLPWIVANPVGGGTPGGGTGGSSGSRTFITWAGSSNSQTVKDANNEDFAFYSDTGCLYSYNTKKETTNFCLNSVTDPSNSSAQFAGLSVKVVSVKASSGGCITQLATASGKLIDIFTNASGVQTAAETSTSANFCSGSSGGGGSGGGTTTRTFVTWVGNDNGQVVKDSNNENFAFYADTGCLYSYNTLTETSNFCLNNLTDPSNATAQFSGLSVKVVSVAASGGGCIAQLASASGKLVDIYTNASGIQVAAETSTAANFCSGGTGGGGGGTVTRSFITWTGSSNGVVVVDSNNERFAFYSDTRCLYSYNRNQETTNFCLGSSNTGSFAGQAVVVLSIAGTGGGCIAGLADPSGFQLDIVTSASGVQTVQKSSTKWDTTGCTN